MRVLLPCGSQRSIIESLLLTIAKNKLNSGQVPRLTARESGDLCTSTNQLRLPARRAMQTEVETDTPTPVSNIPARGRYLDIAAGLLGFKRAQLQPHIQAAQKYPIPC
ncbi:hypothetical protein Y1Q_0002467 [Alligator mississippiensis]|uniref:Uncharacterized protein n=1 Tax=Alligator mississippiensis TaxID=8496 RepID=A0A151NBL5_ALLMI|nr:hypothetical protein Y1Q_0002467 [Alligator mississippiensis]